MKTTILQNHLLQEALLKDIAGYTLRFMSYSDYYVSLEFKVNSVYLYLSLNGAILFSKLITLNTESTGEDLNEALYKLKEIWQEVYMNYVCVVGLYNKLDEENGKEAS